LNASRRFAASAMAAIASSTAVRPEEELATLAYSKCDMRYKHQLNYVKRPFDVAKYKSANRNRVARIQLAIGHWIRILEFHYSTIIMLLLNLLFTSMKASSHDISYLIAEEF